MKKSEWLDCQRNEFFPKQKGIPSLVKIEHKNTATLDSARSKKKSKVAVLQLHFSMKKTVTINHFEVISTHFFFTKKKTFVGSCNQPYVEL